MKMNEREFENLIDRLEIDDEPRIEHREKLRAEMLAAFESGRETEQTETIPLGGYRSTTMNSPYVKIAIAAALIIAAALGIHHLTRNTQPQIDPGQSPVAVTGSPAEPAVAKMVPIPLELPKPMFVGTPQDTKVENLRKPLGEPRPPFPAPEGVTNVALGKPVSATDEEPIIGELEMITDGDKEAADGSYVELGPFAQSVTIDLEADYEIYAIVVWHYHKQARVYFDVICQVSRDKDFIEDTTTLFNNDIDNSAGFGIGSNQHYSETNEGELIPANGVTGRYVRLYSNGNTSNDLNHYIEIEVYGKPVK